MIPSPQSHIHAHKIIFIPCDICDIQRHTVTIHRQVKFTAIFIVVTSYDTAPPTLIFYIML